jgi:hypothetical protein
MEIMKYKAKLGIWTGCLGLASLLFLLITNPQNLSPVFLITPFVLLFLFIMLAGVYVRESVSKSDQLVLKKKNLLLVALASAYPVLLLLLQSIGQLSTRDVITLTLIVLISGFYISKTSLRA